MTHRSQIRIIYDVLCGCSASDEGLGTTQLIRLARMPHGRLVRMLETLLSGGLIEKKGGATACRYVITGKGRDFVDAYGAFAKFSDELGVGI